MKEEAKKEDVLQGGTAHKPKEIYNSERSISGPVPINKGKARILEGVVKRIRIRQRGGGVEPKINRDCGLRENNCPLGVPPAPPMRGKAGGRR